MNSSPKIETELAAGDQRIKIKIKPGWDVEVIDEVRKRFPRYAADGRRQFRLHTCRCRPPPPLDDFYLMMIEQPLAHDESSTTPNCRRS